MKNKKSLEDELNAIRLDLYEATKGMTPDEEIAYLKSLSAPVLKEFGIRIINETQEKKTPKPGCMKGKIWMADDFDAPLDFREYME